MSLIRKEPTRMAVEEEADLLVEGGLVLAQPPPHAGGGIERHDHERDRAGQRDETDGGEPDPALVGGDEFLQPVHQR